MFLFCIWFRNSETLVGLIHQPVQLDSFPLYCKYALGQSVAFVNLAVTRVFLSVVTTGHDNILLQEQCQSESPGLLQLSNRSHLKHFVSRPDRKLTKQQIHFLVSLPIDLPAVFMHACLLLI